MKNHIHLNSEEKFLVKILIVVLIGLIFRYYGLYIQNETIKSAELTSVTDYGYSLSFHGEEHYYSFS